MTNDSRDDALRYAPGLRRSPGERVNTARSTDAEVWQKLHQFVHRISPPWLGDQRDDLTQMAAVKVLRSGKTHLPSALLYRVAYSVVIDEIRRWRRRNEICMSPSMPDRLARSDELSPETRARGSEIGATLIECLGELNADRRRAVTLYLQSHSIPEIAVTLGCNRKRASNLVYRGLSDLRSELEIRGVRP